LKHLLHALVWTRRHLAGELPAPELPLLLPYMEPDDVFLDVGVHAGSWAIPASRALPAGHVYAFEALPYYAKVLKITLALLGRRNVTVVRGAVSDSVGEVAVVWRDAAGQRLTGRTHISSGEESGDAVKVPALTIDGFCRERGIDHVRLMKCDVEGAELMVLRGAAATIDAWRPLVFCEVYEEYCARYGYAAADVFAFFAVRDYRTMQFEDERFRELDPEQYSGCGDVLFMPKEANRISRCA
jgi:FkbM family methyltransferase